MPELIIPENEPIDSLENLKERVNEFIRKFGDSPSEIQTSRKRDFEISNWFPISVAKNIKDEKQLFGLQWFHNKAVTKLIK